MPRASKSVEVPENLSAVAKQVLLERHQAGEGIKTSDVVADLFARWDSVSEERWSQTVSNAKTALRQAGDLPETGRKPRGSTSKAETNGRPSLDDLKAVRALADQIGGFAHLRSCLTELEALIGGG